MFSRTRNDLINKQIEGTIGEPWNFISEAGENLIKGKILAISNDIEKKQWVLLEILPFEAEEKKISSVFATRRYSGEDIISDLLKDKDAECNLTYDPSGKKFWQGDIDKILREKQDSHWLIGGFKVIW